MNLVVLKNVRVSFPAIGREFVTRQATQKLALCIRGARECSRNSWQGSPSNVHKREYLRMKRESMADARYWLAQLRGAK